MRQSGFIIYIAGSFRHMHGVRLLARELERMGCQILDWTRKSSPPPGLTPQERRLWMDTDTDGGTVYQFCHNACQNADLVIYYGSSGQDAGVEVGLARAYGVPVLGIRGPLEQPGLMLHGAATAWVEDAAEALAIVEKLLGHKHESWQSLAAETDTQVQLLGAAMRKAKAGCSGFSATFSGKESPRHQNI